MSCGAGRSATADAAEGADAVSAWVALSSKVPVEMRSSRSRSRSTSAVVTRSASGKRSSSATSAAFS